MAPSGTVANLPANKDYPTMLAAARRMVGGGVPVTFLSVGQGPLDHELARLHDELGLGDRFRFLGYRADPHRALAAGDVFCLSSRYEGRPLAARAAERARAFDFDHAVARQRQVYEQLARR